MPDSKQSKKKKEEKKNEEEGSGIGILIASMVVIGIAIVSGYFMLNTSKNVKYETESVILNPTVQRTPYVQRTAMFNLEDSHNPHYDQAKMMQEYRAFTNPWTVWTQPALQNDFKHINSENMVKIDEFKSNTRFLEIGRLRLTFLTSQMIRIEWDSNSVFQNDNTIVFSERSEYLDDSNNTPPVIEVSDKNNDGKILIISTENLRIVYGKDENGKYYSQSPPPLSDTLSVLIKNESYESTWKPGMNDEKNLGGTVRTLDRTSGPVPLENGLLSVSGWSLVDDTNSPLLVPVSNEYGYDKWAKERNAPDNYSDWTLFAYGTNYRDCLGDFTKVAGKIPLPPKYAFGIWWSRWWKYTDEELKDLVNEFKENNVPLDNLVIDMDWHLTAYDEMNAGAVDRAGQPLGWTGYSWDYEVFPSPSDFLDWCHNQGLKTTLNLHPAAGVQPHEYFYHDIAESMGINPNTSLHVPFDIADQKFTSNYFDIVIHSLEEDGIDFWWLDYQQLQKTNITHLNPTIWLNHCFFNDMERNTRKNVPAPLRGLIFHRWGGLGNHRYQIGFSGDTSSTWSALDFQVYFTTTAANVGFGYWSHDIGGFMSQRPTPPELFTRWVQWGAFSPIYRTHAWRQGYIERRIWKYSPYYFWCMREAIYIRYSLIPFLYTEARASYDTGVSMLHPVYYDYPLDERSYSYQTQGMIGDSMLIAPVTSYIASENLFATKNIFLPGDNLTWIEWHSLTALQSGEYTRNIAIDEIPIYIKAGSVIPMNVMTKDVQNLSQLPEDPTVISIFPGPQSNSGSYRLYHDDGITVNYKNNEHIATTFIESIPKITNNDIQWNVLIHPTEGSFRGMKSSESYVIRMVGVPPPTKVIVNGNSLPYFKKKIYSLEPESFIHWSISRDPSQNFIDENESTIGWFYDYERLTLVLRTQSIKTNKEGNILIKWDGKTKSQWDEQLTLLHKGWINLKNAITRTFLYWHGEINPSFPVRISEKLSTRDPNEWEYIFSEFIDECNEVALKMTEQKPDDNSRDGIINHLKKLIPEK